MAIAVSLAALSLTSAGCGRVGDAEFRTALSSELKRTPRTAEARALREQVEAFYTARDHRAAWTGRRPGIDAVRRLIDAAATHGLEPADYDAEAITALREKLDAADDADGARAKAAAAYDVRVTSSLLALGRDVSAGRVRPETIDARWHARRAPIDLAASLRQAIDSGALAGWLDTIAPRHSEYAALRGALATLRARVAPTAGEDDDGTNGGAAGSATERPTALARQIEIVELNLDRWRWMPDDLGAKHLLVNVPDFMLYAREDGRTIFDMRVVVGTPGRQATPVFSGDMKTIVFNPSWHIPESIATGETAPAVADDPGYLERLNIEVLRRSDSGAPRPVDPESVDWNDPEEIAGLSFRQRPGDSNALGDVKFLFPNRHAIYLHDTPGQSHFEKRTRALSHGCVRVAEPAKLAAHVLRGEAGWDDVRVAAAMKGATEREVTLSRTLPVHIVYFTASVDEGGAVRFAPDVYGHDARQHRRAEARPSF